MKYLNKITEFLNSHRALVVKYFALNYETKIFGGEGESGKYLRAVLPTLFFFYVAICSTLLIDNLGFWQHINEMGFFFKAVLGAVFVLFYFIFWIPFIVCLWIGFPWWGNGYFELYPLKYAEIVSKSQKFQMLNKPEMIGNDDETFPEDEEFKKEYLELKKWNHNKFSSKSNVNALLGIAPFALLLIGFLIAYLIMR